MFQKRAVFLLKKVNTWSTNQTSAKGLLTPLKLSETFLPTIHHLLLQLFVNILCGTVLKPLKC